MTEEEKQIIRDSCCITDEQRKEWNNKIAMSQCYFCNYSLNHIKLKMQHKYEKGQIDALEKLQMDIQERFNNDCHYDYFTADEIYKYIGHLISELKGEAE